MQTQERISINKTRFGDISCLPSDILTFPDGLIGFPDEHEFVVVTTSETSRFVWLQSLSNGNLAFLLTDPGTYVDNYRPLKKLAEQELLYTTVNIPHGKPEEMSLNLAGPICVDTVSRVGKQIVLDTEAYTTRYRVFAQSHVVGEAVAA